MIDAVMKDSECAVAPGLALDIKLGKVYEEFEVDTAAIAAYLEAHGVSKEDISNLKIVFNADAGLKVPHDEPINGVYTHRGEDARILLFVGRILNCIRTGEFGISGTDKSITSYNEMRDFCRKNNLRLKDYRKSSPIKPNQYPILQHRGERALDALLKCAVAFHILRLRPESLQHLITAQEQRERLPSYASKIILTVGGFLEGLGADTAAVIVRTLGARVLGLAKPGVAALYRLTLAERACCRPQQEFPQQLMVHARYREEYARGEKWMHYPGLMRYPTLGSQLFFESLEPLSAPKDIKDLQHSLHVLVGLQLAEMPKEEPADSNAKDPGGA